MALNHKKHALNVAEIAGHAALKFFRGQLEIEFKADESPVTHADKAIETVVREYLSEHFPDDGVFGEEHGFDGNEGDSLWIIDPIDGTRSFLSGHPLFGFLLGQLVMGQPEIGIIGVPALNETYVGMRGHGATLNGAPITVSKTTHLDEAVFFVNEGDKIYRDYPDLFGHLMKLGQTRRFAYDCYAYALLSMGQVDAVLDYDLQPYDYLPVSAVVEAAGGTISDWHGKALSLNSDGRVLAAATRELHAELVDIVSGA